MPQVDTQRRERFETLVLQTDRRWSTKEFQLNDDGEYMYEDLREWWVWFERGERAGMLEAAKIAESYRMGSPSSIGPLHGMGWNDAMSCMVKALRETASKR